MYIKTRPGKLNLNLNEKHVRRQQRFLLIFKVDFMFNKRSWSKSNKKMPLKTFCSRVLKCGNN